MDTLLAKQEQLLERLDSNFNDFKRDMLKSNRADIFDRAYIIADYQITYRHMRHIGQLDEQSLDYLLRFQNPLELVADVCKQDIRVDLDAIIGLICDTQDLTRDYPLMPEPNKKRNDRER